MKQVLIYFDSGVSQESFRKLFQKFENSLSERTSDYILKTADHSFFETNGWETSTVLIAFPGGRDLPYHNHLQGRGNLNIRNYVRNGGCYFGICAGGYYGASYIEFEMGGDLEVCGPRELGFFPGKAIGPAYDKGYFCYESEKGARAAPIRWEQGISKVYFNGGCFFENSEKYASTKVLARYEDLPDSPAAVVQCQFGQGRALLSGIHPEYLHDKDRFWCYLLNKILI